MSLVAKLRSSRILWGSASIAALAAMSPSLIGCPPDPEPCQGGALVCTGASTATECRAGTLVSFDCKGPLGCTDGRCDWSGNAGDELCPLTDDAKGLCATRPGKQLQCFDGKISELPCSGCRNVSTDVVCSDVVDGGADAPDDVIDSGDGTVVSSGPVTVVATAGGVPQPSVNVVFHDRAGKPLAHLLTGSDGRATSNLPLGGAVTLALKAGTQFLLWSWMAVEPGDELTFTMPPTQAVSLGTAQITLPGAHPGASAYDLSMCDGTIMGPSLVAANAMVVSRACVGTASAFGVLAYAVDSSPAPIAYASATGTGLVPGADIPIALGAWETAFDNLGFTVTNAPLDAASLSGRVTLRGNKAPIRTLASPTGAPVNGLSTTVKVPQTVGDSLAVETAVRWADGESSLERVVPKPQTAQSFNLTQMLPRIRSVSIDLSQPAQPVASWTADAPLAAADCANVTLVWGTNHVWVATLPPTTAPSFRVPALPPTLSAWQPSGAEYSPPHVVFVDDSATPDWKAARTRPSGPQALLRRAPLEVGGSRRASFGGSF